MIVDQVLSVWNPATVAFALVAGFLLGFLAVGRYAADPAYASGEASPSEYGVLVTVLAGATGLVFFSFQILGTYLDGDPLWPRVLGRLAIWFIYCAAIGAGTATRLTWHVDRKHAEARENATRELDGR